MKQPNDAVENVEMEVKGYRQQTVTYTAANMIDVWKEDSLGCTTSSSILSRANIKLSICDRLVSQRNTLLNKSAFQQTTQPYFPLGPEGDPGQHAGHAQDAGGNAEVQGRAPAPSGG